MSEGRRSMYDILSKIKEENGMKSKNLALTTLALGAAYLLRNDKSRKKLKNQFLSFAGPSRRGW